MARSCSADVLAASEIQRGQKGSATSGVMGLRDRPGKSSELGDGFSLGGTGDTVAACKVILRFFILRFLRLSRRSYSLKDFLLGPVPETLLGGGGSGASVGGEAPEEVPPVSSWTTFLKEEQSAWTKVVGEELGSMNFGVPPLLMLMLMQLPLVAELGEVGSVAMPVKS